MTRLLILGAGTAGTIIANKLRRKHSRAELTITVVDRDDDHRYQPGYLLAPFTRRDPTRALTRSRRGALSTGIGVVTGEIDRVLPAENAVTLVDGRRLGYDYLVIATGTTPRPDQTPGLANRIAVLRSRLINWAPFRCSQNSASSAGRR